MARLASAVRVDFWCCHMVGSPCPPYGKTISTRRIGDEQRRRKCQARAYHQRDAQSHGFSPWKQAVTACMELVPFVMILSRSASS